MTLKEPITAVDEGRTELPVCIDFLGSNLDRQVIVTLTTVTGVAAGMSLSHSLELCRLCLPMSMCDCMDKMHIKCMHTFTNYTSTTSSDQRTSTMSENPHSSPTSLK